MSKKGGLGKFALGAGIGAALGMLFAPKKGEEMRKELKIRLDDLVEKVRSMDMDDVRDYVEQRIDELKDDLENLNKEQVLEEAQKKAEQLRVKAEELVEYAIENGTPVIEKSANAVKEKIIETSECVIKKLKNNNNNYTKNKNKKNVN